MILIWRGWGLLAFFLPMPTAFILMALEDTRPKWVQYAAAELWLLGAASVCIYCGTLWNRPRYRHYRHEFWFIPLQAWGWFYLADLVMLVGINLAGALIGSSGRTSEAAVRAVELIALVAITVLLARWVVMSAEANEDDEDDYEEDDDDADEPVSQRRKAPQSRKDRGDGYENPWG